MKGRAIAYSAAELAWLAAEYHQPIAALHAAFVTTFGRADVSQNNLLALRKRKGWKTGRTGQFVAGTAPPNKGKPHPTRGRSAETQFKKGSLPHNTQHLGHERINRDGYVEISVAETNPHTGFERRYVHKHRWLWEQANGPVPAGHALKCLDGDKQNTDPSNWEAIHRGILARLNGGRHRRTVPFDQASPRLKPAIMTVAKLKHKIQERTTPATPTSLQYR
jgi:hypothetical protein